MRKRDRGADETFNCVDTKPTTLKVDNLIGQLCRV